ncbi:hypothetical protein D3C76_456550 [compost metagenome]
MAKAKQQASALPTSLDILGRRIQKLINSPAAQKNRVAVICKAPEELQEDWDALVNAIEETDGVSLTFGDDGGVRVTWEKPLED